PATGGLWQDIKVPLRRVRIAVVAAIPVDHPGLLVGALGRVIAELAQAIDAVDAGRHQVGPVADLARAAGRILAHELVAVGLAHLEITAPRTELHGRAARLRDGAPRVRRAGIRGAAREQQQPGRNDDRALHDLASTFNSGFDVTALTQFRVRYNGPNQAICRMARRLQPLVLCRVRAVVQPKAPPLKVE